MKWFRSSVIIILSSILCASVPLQAYAMTYTTTHSVEEQCKSAEALTGVPWEYLAAFYRFEANIRKDKTPHVPDHPHAEKSNPSLTDAPPFTVQFPYGVGKYTTGKEIVTPRDLGSIIYAIAVYLATGQTDRSSIRRKLWDYYHQPVSVDVITHIAEIYRHFQSTQLDQMAFPIPRRYNYTCKANWGDRRAWGGARIHEGVDIFADYGTPVLSTCYGYVELKGWNRYGGWRIGIRDTRNRYHYFAHLGSYAKGLKQGKIVRPKEVLGYVGSSGYGPPGTSGKFLPHLHYGIYKYDGKNTFSFDPYPLLRKWERDAQRKSKS